MLAAKSGLTVEVVDEVERGGGSSATGAVGAVIAALEAVGIRFYTGIGGDGVFLQAETRTSAQQRKVNRADELGPPLWMRAE